jgi:carbonic anhydrase
MLYPHIAGLAGPQNPDTFFLTCMDSRILPNIITMTGPGDLFTVRNPGNLVPTDPAEASVDAALDFAVNEFGVRSVVVCGHSSCAITDALLRGSPGTRATAMTRWLDYAQDSLTAYQENHPARASAETRGFGEADQLGVVNVAVQIERLRHHPILAAAVASGQIRVVGTFFNIDSAHLYEVDQNGIIDRKLATDTT